METEYAISDGVVHHVTGKVIISTAEKSPGISYGDRLRIIGIKLRPITNFNNPGAFYVKKYYERQGIRAAGFVDGGEQIISFGRDSSYNPLIHYLDRLRLGYGNLWRQ